MWAQILFYVVTSILSYLLRPKPPEPKAASLDDFNVPKAQEGSPIPVIFGTVTITGPNVVWYGDLKTVAIRKKGGKK